MGITGPFGAFVALLVASVLGDMLDRGIIELDIKIDKWREAVKDLEWRDAALKAYNHAIEKVYTEEEKDVIRKQYQDALAKYASFGGVPKHQDP